MIESRVQALGPEERPAGSGGERQSQAWALGIAAFAGPGGGWPVRCTGAPQGVGESRVWSPGRRGKTGFTK